ncbi:unnamed protein product [Orchesella dallaii]|uniref:Uncharacterized protein n=1 Tax=Orchesella dallaii TaxID=48710 RepID=A0ABP1QF52_9HEXA
MTEYGASDKSEAEVSGIMEGIASPLELEAVPQFLNLWSSCRSSCVRVPDQVPDRVAVRVPDQVAVRVPDRVAVRVPGRDAVRIAVQVPGRVEVKHLEVSKAVHERSQQRKTSLILIIGLIREERRVKDSAEDKLNASTLVILDPRKLDFMTVTGHHGMKMLFNKTSFGSQHVSDVIRDYITGREMSPSGLRIYVNDSAVDMILCTMAELV